MCKWWRAALLTGCGWLQGLGLGFGGGGEELGRAGKAGRARFIRWTVPSSLIVPEEEERGKIEGSGLMVDG